MHGRNVETLRNLSLMCSIDTLKSAIGKIRQPEDWSNSDCYSLMEEMLDNFKNWKEVNEMVEYHRPLREFLSAAQMHEDFFQLSKWHLLICGDPLYLLIFWLCYQNNEAAKFEMDKIGVFSKPNVFLHVVMKKYQIKMLKCKKALLMLGVIGVETDFENARDLLRRMPNLENLHVRIIGSGENNHFKEKILAEGISHLKHLTTLTIPLGGGSEPIFEYFSLFVKNSPKSLKKLQVPYFSANCVMACYVHAEIQCPK